MGPVDYLMVRFVGNKFNGEIVPELADLEKRGIIRVIDMVLIMKDANGKLFVTEAKDLQGDAGRAFQQIAKNTQEWFYEGDIEQLHRHYQTTVQQAYCFTRTFGPSNSKKHSAIRARN